MVAYAKISPKLVNLRDRAGNAEEEEEKHQTRGSSFPSQVTSVTKKKIGILVPTLLGTWHDRVRARSGKLRASIV